MTDGTLGGVRVLDHHETPGLGDKIEERKSDWIKVQFDGQVAGPTAAENRGWSSATAATSTSSPGATITPRSIVKTVKNTLIYVGPRG